MNAADTKEQVLVVKYGGSSLKTKALFMKAAKSISAKVSDGAKMVVVVSAIGNNTDSLAKRFREYAGSSSLREYDATVSLGELTSAALMAGCICDMGLHAISLNAYQAGIVTSMHHRNARIESIDSVRILKYLEGCDVVVIPGFQGVNADGDITTIGRGGSDTTAVAVAAALGVHECVILTDVAGIYTAHPQKIGERRPKVIPRINYSEVCEMAALGAGVINSRAAQIAAKHKIIIRVIDSTEGIDSTGTMIGPFHSSISTSVTAASLDDSVSLLTLVRDSQNAFELLTALNALLQRNISIKLIVSSGEHGNNGMLDIVVPTDEASEASDALVECELVTTTPIVKHGYSLISIVGQNIEEKTGIAARFLSVFSDYSTNIRLLAGSSLSQVALVSKEDCEQVYVGICSAFDLLEASARETNGD